MSQFKWSLLALLLAGVAITGYLFKKTPAPADEETNASVVTNPPSPAAVPKARAIYTAPRALPSAPQTKPDEIAFKECEGFWTALGQLDLEKTSRFPKATCQKVPADLSAVHQQFLQFCQNLPESMPQGPTPEKAQCQAVSLLYRARVADWLTRSQNLKEITDTKLLADKLLAKFAENPLAAAEIAERLLEQNPDLGFAAKAAAMGRFMDAQGSATGKGEDARWSKALEAIGRMEKNGENPATVAELKLLSLQRRESDPTLFRDEARKLAEENPNLWVGPYYAAWGEHLLGNTDRAREWLEVCLKQNPSESRCMQGKQRLTAGEKSVFQSHVTFGLNPLAE